MALNHKTAGQRTAPPRQKCWKGGHPLTREWVRIFFSIGSKFARLGAS